MGIYKGNEEADEMAKKAISNKETDIALQYGQAEIHSIIKVAKIHGRKRKRAEFILLHPGNCIVEN